jgi:glycosyltransferase involved in cell wall biosynthesis
MQKRFAIVAPNYHPRTCGVGDYSMRIAAELLRRGHEVKVFTRAPARPDPEEPTVPVLGVDEVGALRIATEIAGRVERGGFTDVIIQYTPRMWDASRFGSAALPTFVRRMRKLGLPIALVIHEPCPPWSKRPDLAVGAALLRAQLAMTIRASRRSFITTESRRALLSGIYAMAGAPPPRVLRVGPNAAPAPAAWRPDGHRIGLFSTLAVGRRFDVVVDAFDEISRTIPDAELVLIGDFGPPASAAARALSARIARSARADRIRVTGRLPLGEIAKIIATLNVYFFAQNTGANTRSSTLPGAFATGVPVVAIRGPETDGLFVDGENVLFADDLDGPSFAKAALRIFADRSLADRLSAGGRRLHDEHLSWPRIVDSLLDAIA